ncbi:MAG: TraR/DksA family transcriptional regulator [Natronospirillum sp.]
MTSTQPDINDFRQRLETWRDQLSAAIAEDNALSDTVVLDQSKVGRLSRMDALQAQQMAMAADRRRKQQLKAVLQALSRIENDEYGECLDCGEWINTKRLEFDPTAHRCVQCASQHG